MTYKDYQKASYKHLNSCKAMLNSLQLLSGNNQAVLQEPSSQKALLQNIFYLSGYTLECIINYSILKHFKWKEDKMVDDTTPDHNFSKRCGLAFYPNTRTENGGTYYFEISKHNFQRNIQVLRKGLPSSKIPYVDPAIQLTATTKSLITAWQVEVRYNDSETKYSSIELTEPIIKEFLEFTDKVYTELMKKVG